MDQTPPHIVFLASPGMGHFIPCLELAKNVVIHHNFSATILISPNLGPKWSSQGQQPFLQPNNLPTGLNYLLLPQPDFNDDDLPPNTNPFLLEAYAIRRSLPSIRKVLSDLTSQKLKIVALVVDLFGLVAIDIAREYGISPYLFFTTSAMCLSLFLYVPKLDQCVSCEYRELPDPIQLPGDCIPIPGNDVPEPMPNRQGNGYKALLEKVKKYPMVDGIIVNTFKEMEPQALKGLQL